MILKEYLFRSGMTQTEFAKKAGVCRAHICDVSTGRIRPSTDLALKICELTKGSVTLEEALFPADYATFAPIKYKSKRMAK